MYVPAIPGSRYSVVMYHTHLTVYSDGRSVQELLLLNLDLSLLEYSLGCGELFYLNLVLLLEINMLGLVQHVNRRSTVDLLS